jgi:hypothetical protein
MNANPRFTDWRDRALRPPKTIIAMINGWSVRRALLMGMLAGLAPVLLMAAVTQIQLTTQVQGILPVANGGTGLATLTANTVYRGNGTGVMQTTAVTDNGTIVKVSESLDVTSNGFVAEIANASSTGTTVNKLAKLTGAPSTAVIAATSDTTGEVGVVIGGAGTSSNAQIAVLGIASCIADNATTAGDYVIIGTGTAGDCRDGTSTKPTTGQILGVWLTTTSAGSAGNVWLFGPGSYGSNSANYAFAETPGGTINGSNTSFTLAHTPTNTSLALYKNGQLQLPGGGADYTLSGSTITYNTAPLTGDLLTAQFYTY